MTVLTDTATPGNLIEEKTGEWKPIKSAPRDGTVIDVWLSIHASPLSMGMRDSFGVPDTWFDAGKWVHTYKGEPTELNRNYITHWRPKSVTKALMAPDRDPKYAEGGWIGPLFLIMVVAFGLLLLNVAAHAEEPTPQNGAASTSFCMRDPVECPSVPPAFASVDQVPLVAKIRAYADQNFTYQSDQAHYGVGEWWTLIRGGRGDCEDFALTMRSLLAKDGIPYGAMRLRAVQMWNQRYHMVLDVRYANGDVWVLDSAKDDPYLIGDDPYWAFEASAWGTVTDWHAG